MIHTIDPVPIIGYGVGDRVVYYGTSDEQVNWGSHDDPRLYLKAGEVYRVSGVEIHDFHTKVFLAGYEDKKFPSSAFKKDGERE